MTPGDPLSAYRPNAGSVLFNSSGKVWIGRRADTPPPDGWQFPQGGIDDGETPRDAAWRELTEETGIAPRLADYLGGIEDWLTYDFPPEVASLPRHARRGWKGQKQRWFAFRFLGQDSDIDLGPEGEVEFAEWRWEDLRAVPGLIIPWKRDIYERVARDFAHYAESSPR